MIASKSTTKMLWKVSTSQLLTQSAVYKICLCIKSTLSFKITFKEGSFSSLVFHRIFIIFLKLWTGLGCRGVLWPIFLLSKMCLIPYSLQYLGVVVFFNKLSNQANKKKWTITQITWNIQHHMLSLVICFIPCSVVHRMIILKSWALLIHSKVHCKLSFINMSMNGWNEM